MRLALMPALTVVASTVALSACGSSDTPSTDTVSTGARLGSTVQTKTTQTSVPGAKQLSKETTQLKVQASQLAQYGNSYSTLVSGIGGLGSISAFTTEAGRTELESELKRLETEAQKAQATSQNEEDLLQQMRDLIRDLQAKLAAIQAEQGDSALPVGRT